MTFFIVTAVKNSNLTKRQMLENINPEYKHLKGRDNLEDLGLE
jgi:hypothetical protein